MTETDYQNECIKAELFDLPIPTREEFFARQKEIAEAEGNAQEEEEEEEMTTTEQEENAGVRQEGFRRIGGGLDELNSILSSTQKKLNRFKTIYGSLSNLLKVKIGSKNEESGTPVNTTMDSGSGNKEGGEETKPELQSGCSVINKGGGSQLDKLDSLISKAERAEISLSSQNKQMRKFLN